MKKGKVLLLLVVSLVLIVFVNGCHYVYSGQFKSVKKLEQGKELNLYECCSIYTMHLAAVVFGALLSPEAAEQCLLMQFAREGSSHYRRVDFMKSEHISNLFVQNAGKSFVVNYPLNEITANKDSDLRKELRYALAFDGAVFKWEEDRAVLELDVKYDAYTARYNVGPFDVTFNWQLLKYIQDRGWLHKCLVIYVD